jgi:hypothetical protein
MKFSFKIKCQHCVGIEDTISTANCKLCEGKGCLRIGWIEWVCWQIAKYFKTLIERYGDQ